MLSWPERYAIEVRLLPILMALTILGGTTSCRRRARQPVPARAPVWLEQVAYEQVVAAAPGSQPMAAAFKGVARRQGGRQKYRIPFEKGRCYVISAAADKRTAREIYVNLWDRDNDRVAKDRNGTPYMVLEHCAKKTGPYTFELKITRGNGHFLALVYERMRNGQPAGPPPPPPSYSPAPVPSSSPATPPAQPALPSPAKGDLAVVVDEHARVVTPNGRRIGAHYQGAGASSDWYPTLENGKCYWFVVASRSSAPLELSLRAPTGKPLKNQPASASPAALKYCPDVGAMYHFNVKTSDPNARYKAGIYAAAR